MLDYISSFCGVDIFLLGPKLTPMVDGMTGDSEMRIDQRWRVAIYGDILSSEHAKARVLIHIDTLVRSDLRPIIKTPCTDPNSSAVSSTSPRWSCTSTNLSAVGIERTSSSLSPQPELPYTFLLCSRKCTATALRTRTAVIPPTFSSPAIPRRPSSWPSRSCTRPSRESGSTSRMSRFRLPRLTASCSPASTRFERFSRPTELTSCSPRWRVNAPWFEFKAARAFRLSEPCGSSCPW